MRRRRSAGRLELPIDTADATGVFGVVAGVLSLGIPYFVGLAATLSALGLAVAVPRIVARRPAQGRLANPNRLVLASAALALAGWGGFAVASWLFPTVRGAVLGASGLPLWWTTRRPLPFAGG